jgi:negative regulator of flagellin synthesis FlgM
MTEKISNQGFRPVDTAGTRRSEASKATRTGQGASGAQGSGATGTAGDTVNVSKSGLLMARLQEVVQNTPVTDAGRVAALKDAITSGRYQIDDQKTADNLLRTERQMQD